MRIMTETRVSRGTTDKSSVDDYSKTIPHQYVVMAGLPQVWEPVWTSQQQSPRSLSWKTNCQYISTDN